MVPRGKMASCPTLICLFAYHVGRWGTISWSHPFGARGLLWDRVPWLQLNRGNIHCPCNVIALSCMQWIEVPGVNHLSFGVSDALWILMLFLNNLLMFSSFLLYAQLLTLIFSPRSGPPGQFHAHPWQVASYDCCHLIPKGVSTYFKRIIRYLDVGFLFSICIERLTDLVLWRRFGLLDSNPPRSLHTQMLKATQNHGFWGFYYIP